MKKWIVIVFVIIISIVGVCFYYFKSKSLNNKSEYNVNRTSTTNNTQEEVVQQEQHIPTEAEDISSFSTKIYTKDSNRQKNIGITCSTLNDTDVANGSTFSFCSTVGPASPSKGYVKADIFNNGKKVKGYGGGNCQISTTLYNAVLAVPALSVTERHEHSNKVPYISEGKDAAVSYGSYDFKFVNNTGFTIRIKANHTTDNITIRLVKIV